ncbi:MAG: fluoride efflux transporter CrcB [Chitinophagaceae bacterium]
MKAFLIVTAGSGLGGALRYFVQVMVYRFYPSTFPFGTFAINIIGCFFIGLFFALSEKGNLLSSDTRLFLVTGLCGGFTTFSSFSVENFNLLKSGYTLYFILYAIGSVVLGLLATYAGFQIVKGL